MLYNLNLYSDVYQLLFNKTGKTKLVLSLIIQIVYIVKCINSFKSKGEYIHRILTAKSIRHTQFDPSVWKILKRRARQPTPVFLPGESHGQRSLVGYSPQHRKKSDMTKATQHATHILISNTKQAYFYDSVFFFFFLFLFVSWLFFLLLLWFFPSRVSDTQWTKKKKQVYSVQLKHLLQLTLLF